MYSAKNMLGLAVLFVSASTANGESGDSQITITQAGAGFKWTMSADVAGVVAGTGDFPDISITLTGTLTSAKFTGSIGGTHNFLIKDAAGKDVAGAQTLGGAFDFDWTPSAAGIYTYYCGQHSSSMNGKITVTKPTVAKSEGSYTIEDMRAEMIEAKDYFKSYCNDSIVGSEPVKSFMTDYHFEYDGSACDGCAGYYYLFLNEGMFESDDCKECKADCEKIFGKCQLFTKGSWASGYGSCSTFAETGNCGTKTEDDALVCLMPSPIAGVLVPVVDDAVVVVSVPVVDDAVVLDTVTVVDNAVADVATVADVVTMLVKLTLAAGMDLTKLDKADFDTVAAQYLKVAAAAAAIAVDRIERVEFYVDGELIATPRGRRDRRAEGAVTMKIVFKEGYAEADAGIAAITFNRAVEAGTVAEVSVTLADGKVYETAFESVEVVVETRGLPASSSSITVGFAAVFAAAAAALV